MIVKEGVFKIGIPLEIGLLQCFSDICSNYPKILNLLPEEKPPPMANATEISAAIFNDFASSSIEGEEIPIESKGLFPIKVSRLKPPILHTPSNTVTL